MNENMGKKTPSGFERFVFMITRVFALSGAVVIIAAIVVLAIALLSIKSGNTTVTYDDITNELTLTDSKEVPSKEEKEPTSPGQVAIPNDLKPLFEGGNSNVLRSWLKLLSESQQHDFLNNMSNVLAEAKGRVHAQGEMTEVINKYRDLKLAKLRPSEYEKYTTVAMKAGYIAGIFALLLILSIVSLVLVMLAIERNTRQVFS